MRRSIGRKLVFSYLLLIMITLVVSGASFYALIRQYAVLQAKDSLQIEAQRLIQFIEQNGGNVPGKQQQILTHIALRMIESNFVLVQRDMRVVAGSSLDLTPGSTFPVRMPSVFTQGESVDGETTWNGRDIVYVALPASSRQGVQALVLYTDIEQVRSVSKEIARMLWRAFLITAAVMLVLAFLMMRSLLRPVQVLRQGVQRLARRDFTPPKVLTTGDELEELSRAFRDMTLELKQYDEGQRRFLQNASHELKTPLMAIQGYAEGIRDGIFKGDDEDRVLDVISAESIRLKKLVDELIYLSKLETLEDMYNPQQIDLRELAEDAVGRLEPLCLQKGVAIRVETQDPAYTLVDPDKMMQALINLLGNAIRHARQTVTLRLETAADSVRMTIADDGTGFSGEEQGRIFERFFHGDKGETGLGLAITKAIIEKSGGSIKAHNSSSGGAVFTIELPSK